MDLIFLWTVVLFCFFFFQRSRVEMICFWGEIKIILIGVLESLYVNVMRKSWGLESET